MSDSISRREFLVRSSAAGVAVGLGSLGRATLAGYRGPWSPNGEIRIACVGLRGKGKHHMNGFQSVDGASVVAGCDVDESVLNCRVAQIQKRTGRKIKRFVDYRRLLEDPDLDAVSIATPNHTHALIAIAAMEAGKDVYVEKPCSHNIWEGRQLVAAARKYQRMCQHGTQGRSSPAIREAIEKLREGVIGQLHMAHALCFQWRPSIVHASDEPVPPTVHYDLWLGPAPLRPFSRSRFHYNWHWDWDYGNGDMGNQGVHEMDIARWGLGVGLPKRVWSGGRPFMFHDDRETPNRLWSIFQYPDQEKILVFQTRNWIATQAPPGNTPPCKAPAVSFYGSEGYMQVYCFGYQTYLGKNCEPGPSGIAAPNEYERFVAGIRSRTHEDLGVEIEDGHLTSALCHLGNIAHRLDRPVTFDPKTETFPGDDEANAMLSRGYRKPYVVPEIV